MEFIPLHFKDKISIINKYGTVGIITLWSKIDYIKKLLADNSIDLNPETSSIAIIGNLYGNGLKQMLRNLLYNPQITDLVVFGMDRSGSYIDLKNFFDYGVEKYIGFGIEFNKIVSRERILDSLINPSLFRSPPTITYIDDPIDTKYGDKLRDFFQKYRIEKNNSHIERIDLKLKEAKVSHFPSNPCSHTIIKKTPVAAWEELIFRIIRFGAFVQLNKGERQELQNVKVVIENPVEEPELLIERGFSIDRIREYQSNIISGELRGDETYNYGHRIRTYFGTDGIQECISRINSNYQDRHSLIILWDSQRDLVAGTGCPCLFSIFFRVFNDKLTLTATFRTHNALDAWLLNVYGLMQIQKLVSEGTCIEPGAITIIIPSPINFFPFAL